MKQSNAIQYISRATLALFATAALASCSGEATSSNGNFEEATEHLANEESAVTGGNLVTQDEFDVTNHLQATVRYQTVGGGCTGTKLGPHHFLTAAHCVDGVNAGDTVDLTNQIDGNLWGPNAYNGLTIQSVTIHPTWEGSAGGNAADVAFFDIVEETPTIPEFEQDQFDTRVFPDGEWARTIGYGCDDTGTNDGQKQWGDFQAYSQSSLARGEEHYYDRTIISFTPDVRLCPGDSGGPLIQIRGDHWRIVGVNSFMRREDNLSGFARLSSLGNNFLVPAPPIDTEACIAECFDNCTYLQYDQIGQCQYACPDACR